MIKKELKRVTKSLGGGCFIAGTPVVQALTTVQAANMEKIKRKLKGSRKLKGKLKRKIKEGRHEWRFIDPR